MYKPKVYTASRLYYGNLWRAMREDPDWDFVEWTASWPFSKEAMQEEDGYIPSPEIFREGWIRDVAEIKQSDFLIIYGKNAEALRGAIVEAGVALGNGITVVAVGLDFATHSWLHHPNVVVFSSLREAKLYLYKFTSMAPPVRRGRRERDEE